MNHFVFVLYLLCLVLDMLTIVISAFLYREYRSRVFMYLSLLMSGALLSMLVEAFRTYGVLISDDIGEFQRLVYLTLEPAGEILQFLLLPATAWAALGREYPRRQRVVLTLYAGLVIATFPLEAVIGSSVVNTAREVAGHFVFHIAAYLILLTNLKSVEERQHREILKRYLFLGAGIIPSALGYQGLLLGGLLPQTVARVPLPYILYCILFNLLCIANAFLYHLIPPAQDPEGFPESFFREYGITSREREIIEHLLRGSSNVQIAQALFISAPTVKNHIYHIFKKTGAVNRMQLAHKLAGYRDYSLR
jgi:DNA-binding CsgD family transcriptional regulator